MGVTQQDIAGVLAYLLAAQAITATDGQVVVWHDYLTHTVPGLDAAELPAGVPGRGQGVGDRREGVAHRRRAVRCRGAPGTLGAGARQGVRTGRVDPRQARCRREGGTGVAQGGYRGRWAWRFAG